MNESKKLTKQSIIYLHILHVVWVLVAYYTRLFGIDAGEEPAKIPVVHIERDGLTILRFKFLPYGTPNSENYTTREIREIMQQYLDYCLLPEETVLRPYVGGSTVYDIVEPLYIDKVWKDGDMWAIDLIYIDNPIAYKFVQMHKWKGELLL